MPEQSQQTRPFSMDYVLRVTAKHMSKSVDISIRKTFERIKEFDGNRERSEEVFKTLSKLHELKAMLEDYQQTNIVEAEGVAA